MDQIANALSQAGVVRTDEVVTPNPVKSTDDVKKAAIADTARIAKLAAKLAPQYGAVECSSANGSVSEKYGRKSIAVIAAKVPITSLGIVIEVTLWGQLVNKPDGTEISFSASMPKGIKALDSIGKDRLLAHVENSCVRWAGYDKATDAAQRELLGQKPKPVAGEVGRPRLVKQVKLAASDTAA